MTSLIVTFALGMFSWTFLEYVIHRWLGHDPRYRGNPFGVEHVRHHAEGNYFAPTPKKAALAALVAVVIGGPAAWLAGAHGAAAVGGLLVMYGTYEVLHRREHTHAGIGRYGRWARRHHFHHHFVDPKTNHGVTTPLWDLVFGTYRTPEIIPVPAKLCMRWLLDDAGAVRAEHAARYQLRGARS
ncbi:MAG: sterol desaturase family protein [Myxococcales bacterium]|nr:sterol desaturase family protein [Myxococcales bacterium]